jgi:hypothetical protein
LIPAPDLGSLIRLISMAREVPTVTAGMTCPLAKAISWSKQGGLDWSNATIRAVSHPWVRPAPVDYSGLLGEGSIPAPLPPPVASEFQLQHPRKGPKSPAKLGFGEFRAVLEIADFWPNWSGEGIFLQSFVLRRFSTVQKSETPEAQLEIKILLSSKLCWMSECDARTVFGSPLALLNELSMDGRKPSAANSADVLRVFPASRGKLLRRKRAEFS